MIVTIYEGVYDTVIFESVEEEFCKKYGSMRFKVSRDKMLEEMTTIATWVNNDLNEECLFEVG